MKVRTNNKTLAIEVLSAQNLFKSDIDEITILGKGSPKYALNDYDAIVTVNDMEFILFRDLDFRNINITEILKVDLKEIEFIIDGVE